MISAFIPRPNLALFLACSTVVCMDDSPKQLIKETRLPLDRNPGCDAREDFEYERCGVSNIFMVNEPLTGKRFVTVTERKTKRDWALLIKEIADLHYPTAHKIRLISDSLNTHKPAALYETFPPCEAKRIWDRFDSFTRLSTEVG